MDRHPSREDAARYERKSGATQLWLADVGGMLVPAEIVMTTAWRFIFSPILACRDFHGLPADVIGLLAARLTCPAERACSSP